MRTLHRLPARLISLGLATAAAAGAATPASAQFYGNPNSPYQYHNQTYSYGLNLPQVPLPNGQDEVRSADGTTCRSSMASNSAYLDVGAIGSQGYGGEFDQGTFYGRIIVPLGDTPRRIDCTKLYELEIQRLKHELALVQGGLGKGFSAEPTPSGLAGVSAQALGGTVQVPAGRERKTVVISSAKRPAAAAPERPAPAAPDKAWAETGWTNSGWQNRANLGAGDLPPPPERKPVASPLGGAAEASSEVLPWKSVQDGAAAAAVIPVATATPVWHLETN
ncbi:MAG: hypothetical protein NW205_13555 [Hyphomicrobiaceae bacterium]|nr:hypothetical protein [Hyphomicrobiaceae bacterium]